MCGRFTLISDLLTICTRFGIDPEDISLSPRYNIAPGQPLLAILEGPEGKRGEMLLWGLVPSWSKEEKSGYKLINIRKESLSEKKYMKTLLAKQRCIIPADSFFEWRAEGTKKIPFRVLMKDKQGFALAGVWDVWRGSDGKTVKSAAIITTDANPVVQPLHNRMPVILKKEDEAVWLNPAIQDPNILLPLLSSSPSADLNYYEVGKSVNYSKIDDPQCINPN